MKRTTPLTRKTPLRARKDSISFKHQAYYREHCLWNCQTGRTPLREHRRSTDYLVARNGSWGGVFKAWFYDGALRDGGGQIIDSAILEWAEPVPLPSKFGAKTKRVVVPVEGGEKVARSLNGMERDWGARLELRQRAGEISDLEYQRTFHLTHPALPGLDIPYTSDNDYIEDGRLVIDDVKGVADKRFALLCQLWPHMGPAPLRVVKKGRHGLAISRTIYPKVHE